MRYSICQNRDALRRLKMAHQRRALLKRHEAVRISRAEDGDRPLVADNGRASK